MHLTAILAVIVASFSCRVLAAEIELFQPDRVLDIDIEMNHWSDLKEEWPAGGRCVWGYIGDQFQWHQAEKISVAGMAFFDAGIRKKSWCNSFSTTKPSLKISFGRHSKDSKEEAKDKLGTDDLVLNNALQDPALVRQCLAYEIWREAGMVAPMCNFAKVSVNGTSYGIYVNIEQMRKRFLKKHFGKPLGNLYEIAGEDLVPWAYERLLGNLKGYGAEDLVDIKRLHASFGRVEEDPSQLDALIDSDQIIRFWAMEMLVTQWDGFTHGLNNSLIYFDEADGGKAKLLPWGMDSVLFADDDRAKSVYVSESNSLIQALYSQPDIRRRLAEEMERQKLHWDESHWQGRVEDMIQVLEPHLSRKERDVIYGAVRYLQARIKARRAEMSMMIESIEY